MVDKWCQDNPEQCRESKAKWRVENRERLRQYATQYRKENPERVTEQNSKWYEENKGYKLNWHSEYKKRRRKENLQERLRVNLRNRFRKALKDRAKKGSAVNELGCTIPALIKHLEGLFRPGMSWDNYGEWHIDHIRPLSGFDLSDPEQVKKACHFTNLQPLWAGENLSKGGAKETS